MTNQIIHDPPKHTPGPWRFHIKHGNQRTISGEPRGDIAVALCPGDDEIADANARLIAAAPRMLSALKEMAERCRTCNGSGSIWVRTGPDDADRDVCDDCFVAHMAIQEATRPSPWDEAAR